MPLSEDEQRILREIEQQFYATDPAFADQVGRSSLFRHGVNRLKLSGLLFVAGLAVLVWMVVLGNWVLAFALGAAPMFAAAILFEANVRKLGKAGIQQVTSAMRGGAIRDAFGNARNRFRRGD